mgnify:FL=1
MKWKNKDTVSFDWCIDDVKQQLKDRGIKIKFSNKDCREVLDRCLRKHDATMGMSWSTMNCHIDDIIEEKGYNYYKRRFLINSDKTLEQTVEKLDDFLDWSSDCPMENEDYTKIRKIFEKYQELNNSEV